MFKLTVMNIDGFLVAVNRCSGPVYLLDKDGRSVNLRADESARAELRRRYLEDGLLKLDLEIPMPRDYLHITFSAI